MAVLKQIKFGTDNATPIAQTIVTAASDSVVSVNGTHTDLSDNNDPSYEVDLRIDGTTLVKSIDDKKVLKVGTVPAAQVSVADEAGVFTAENVETALKELKDNINTVGGEAKSYKIVATEPASINTLAEYKIQEKVGSDGTWSDVNDSVTIAVPKDQHLKNVELVNQRPADTEHGETDPVSGQFLKFTYVLTNGSESDVYVDVSAFLTEKEFGNGLQASSAGVVSVKIDETSETFLTVGEGGVKLAGVQNAINTAVSTAVENLDVDDTAKDGEYVSQVSETNGKIAVVRANVSEAVLNGYAKGSAPVAGSEAVAASDTINKAISKLEHQVDAAKAATTAAIEALDKEDTAAEGKVVTAVSTADGKAVPTKADFAGITLGGFTADSSAAAPITSSDTLGAAINKLQNQISAASDDHTVVEHASGNTYVTVSSVQNVNGGTTYTVKENDIASAQALTKEIGRAQKAEKEIADKVGLTGAEGSRTFAPTNNYGAGSTSVVDNMQKLDTQLKKVTDDLAAVRYQVNGTTLEFFGISLKTV